MTTARVYTVLIDSETDELYVQTTKGHYMECYDYFREGGHDYVCSDFENFEFRQMTEAEIWAY